MDQNSLCLAFLFPLRPSRMAQQVPSGHLGHGYGLWSPNS
jgi:hypothetical protein